MFISFLVLFFLSSISQVVTFLLLHLPNSQAQVQSQVRSVCHPSKNKVGHFRRPIRRSIRWGDLKAELLQTCALSSTVYRFSQLSLSSILTTSRAFYFPVAFPSRLCSDVEGRVYAWIQHRFITIHLSFPYDTCCRPTNPHKETRDESAGSTEGLDRGVMWKGLVGRHGGVEDDMATKLSKVRCCWWLHDDWSGSVLCVRGRRQFCYLDSSLVGSSVVVLLFATHTACALSH